MLFAVATERVGQQRVCVLFREVWLSLMAGDLGGHPANDHTITALVEEPGDAGFEGGVVTAAVEGHSDETVVQVSGLAWDRSSPNSFLKVDRSNIRQTAPASERHLPKNQPYVRAIRPKTTDWGISGAGH